MRFMGIDYGEKRVGIALSDKGASMAFPHAVFENKRDLLDRIIELVEEYGVGEIVLGESKKLSGEENIIMKDIHEFKERLETALDLPVHFEPEFYSSVQAARIQKEKAMSDARAAAIILQSFLDKKGNKA